MSKPKTKRKPPPEPLTVDFTDAPSVKLDGGNRWIRPTTDSTK